MKRILPFGLVLALLVSSCAPASRNAVTELPHTNQLGSRTVSTSVPDAVPHHFVDPNIELSGKSPSSMMTLPRSQDGEIILSPGYYETEFKSYCLQPGTPGPSGADAYFQAPLSGNRKDMVETVLRNSLDHPELEQRNIQLLLWNMVSGGDFNRLSGPVKGTARTLLTNKQIFQLQGGVMNVVRQVTQAIPIPELSRAYGEMKNLFDLGNSSYEAYERIAVLNQAPLQVRSGAGRDQWYLQDAGYYVRYQPENYQKVKVQVYVPDNLLDSTGKKGDSYVLFDPVTMMAVPSSTNAQHLGIGAPIGDVIRKVIVIDRPAPPSNGKDAQIRKFPKGVTHL
jgi:hypothetical protein